MKISRRSQEPSLASFAIRSMESESRRARKSRWTGSLEISSIGSVGFEVATLCTGALGLLDLKHRIRVQSRALGVGDIVLANLRR